MESSTGKALRACVGGLEVRTVAEPGIPGVRSFGIIDGGLELMEQAVSGLEWKWSIRRSDSPYFRYKKRQPNQARVGPLPARWMEERPVDLLWVEQGGRTVETLRRNARWEEEIETTSEAKRPKVIFESWKESATLWKGGPTSKLAVSIWKGRGYYTRSRVVNATEVGGAIQQQRLLVARLHYTAPKWEWPAPETGPTRSMENHLTPDALLRPKYLTNPCRTLPPHYQTHPMPLKVGTPILTGGGIRRLRREEVARGLGEATLPEPPPLHLVGHSTAIFLWEYMAQGFDSEAMQLDPLEEQEWQEKTRGESPDHEDFQWRPADLTEGGTWYQERMNNLRAAALHFSDPEKVIQEGRDLLRVHRANYDHEGPQPRRLQVLWWEFPPEHWIPLKEGSRMNFLEEPPNVLHDNADMDEDQLQVACEFVDELVDLGVLVAPGPGVTVKATTPLFVIPKEGQPGQWRVIADMLRGGQNGSMGNDPVHLPRVTHILDLLYEGGYSAVVDASKFFYQFSTHRDDHPYLGIKHPRTQELLVWGGCPMGAGQSPALGSRYGLAFVRKIIESSPLFQGEFHPNCYWTGPQRDKGFNPALGYGYFLKGPHGLVVKIWVFVDDFLIHAPTRELCTKGLSFFLDSAVNCGMLCHPKKLVTPRQVVKYCGVLFDTRAIPALHMPRPKRERALGMVRYVLSRPNKEWSCLALAVLTGVLESLSECTPRRMGHTHLRRVHPLVHPGGEGAGLETYLRCTRISEQAREDLRWWEDHLLHGTGRIVRPSRSSVLIPTFGDGSGTGTGGTIQLPSQGLQMWKAVWSPQVYSFSSNWKEISTLRLTLENIHDRAPLTVRNTTVFYFTDNSTTYWVVNGGSSKSDRLHGQLEHIRKWEDKLQCHLAVVHVPGRVIITEGTDGLSRGIWLSPFHDQIPRDELLPAIFAPLHPDPALALHYYSLHVRAHHDTIPDYPSIPWERWDMARWDRAWSTIPVLGRGTVWFPPPELARNVITHVLDRYTEAPLTTTALFFVPRVVPAFWKGLSKHLVELPLLHPHSSDLAFPPLLPIPIMVLYLPPHLRTKPTKNRLDKAPPPLRAQWHQRQAALMRGVSPVSGSWTDPSDMPLCS